MLTDTLRTLGIRVQSSELEDFDVRGDRSAIDECFVNIRESDYYVLIIGRTRGSLLEDQASVTRHELRVAREAFKKQGHPVIRMFLLQDVAAARER